MLGLAAAWNVVKLFAGGIDWAAKLKWLIAHPAVAVALVLAAVIWWPFWPMPGLLPQLHTLASQFDTLKADKAQADRNIATLTDEVKAQNASISVLAARTAAAEKERDAAQKIAAQAIADRDKARQKYIAPVAADGNEPVPPSMKQFFGNF